LIGERLQQAKLLRIVKREWDEGQTPSTPTVPCDASKGRYSASVKRRAIGIKKISRFE
jgi:hypothetical protein